MTMNARAFGWSLAGPPGRLYRNGSVLSPDATVPPRKSL